MEVSPPPLILDVDRLDDGVLVSFADGRSAFYHASLLLDIINQAEIQPPESPESTPPNAD